jgi:2-polyprenyl-3-methyl-5-hydroxy-6-metoxy-1,4-benzoquinol methylase
MFPQKKLESWEQSQKVELDFWVNSWPYRNLPREEIISEVRSKDAHWFLQHMGFPVKTPNKIYDGFEGKVLEVGCGPIGFFENIEGITVKAIDPLMKLFADNLSFSQYGKYNNCDYSDDALESIKETFDFVVCSNVIDHTDNWAEFSSNLTKKITPNTGELLIYTHCRYEPSPGHTQVFSPNNLLTLFLKNNMFIRYWKVLPDKEAHADWHLIGRMTTY